MKRRDDEDQAHSQPIEMLKPITSRDFTAPDPWLPKPKSERPVSDLPRAAQELVTWARRYDFAKHLPLAISVLNRLPIGDLRTGASVFKHYDPENMRGYSREELIAFVGAHQHEPGDRIDVRGELPYGNLPDLTTIDEVDARRWPGKLG